MKTTEEMIAVMQAHEDGEVVQRRTKRSRHWMNVSDSPAWDWGGFDYRVKREPNYADCRCGGNAEDGTARYAIGYIYCDSCGIRKKKRASLWCK